MASHGLFSRAARAQQHLAIGVRHDQRVFIGRLIGVNGLAAISAFFPVLFLLVSFLIGLCSGSTVLVGQAYGARDDHK